LILHHNAPAHSSLQLSQFLAGKGISAMDYPPYCPGLAPGDFWMFPKLRRVLKGKRSLDIEDIKSSVKISSTDISVQDFRNCLDNGQSAGTIVKNWREIPLKNIRLLISAALK
jgi:hypothetical protein